MSDPRLPDPELDPTTVQPTVSPAWQGAAHTPAAGQPTFPPGAVQTDFDSYGLPPERSGPSAAAITSIILVLLLVIGAIVFFVTRSDDSGETVITDNTAAITLTIQRIAPNSNPIPASIVAEIAGPVGAPEAFIWLAPANAIAPAAATAVTNDKGEVVFQWAPLDRIDQSSEWRSNVVLQEELRPNETLAAVRYACALSRPDALGDGETTSNISVAAEIETAPLTEARGVSYRFPGHDFLPGDRVRCEIVAGELNVEPTTTLAPETTLESTTSVVPETTVVSTTVPVTTAPAPATTAAPATTVAPTTTETPFTNALTIVDARTDLSTFRNLIDRAGLREQLGRDDARITLLAPDNDAIAAFLAEDGAPDLNDAAEARTFVLSYVFVGDILESSDIAARRELQFEEGSAQAVDVTVSPITVGGAPMIAVDDLTDLAVVHTLGSTFVVTE
jgi:hypothetical protein